jgi:hypothetical protein
MEGILVRDFATGEPAREKSGAVSRRALVLEGDMFLTESYVAGAASPVVREMTLGDLLRKAAEDHPALIAGVPDPALRRQWTYAQFYREAQRTARALLPRLRRLARR